METGQRKIRFLLQLLAISLTCAPIANAEYEEADGVTFAPSFMSYEISQEIDGAKSTVLTPIQRTRTGVRVFTKETWEKEGHDWETWMTEAMKVADDLAENLEFKWVKDDNDVYLYAAFEVDDPLLNSMILSEKFLPRFEKQLGSQLLVVMPDRTSLYVFPKFGGKLSDYGGALRSKYQNAVAKVSEEIFEVSKNGYRAVGSINAK
ncbi:MAG: hypothetical protein AAF585_24960 [Verrucomicrobiota bacterium]